MLVYSVSDAWALVSTQALVHGRQELGVRSTPCNSDGELAWPCARLAIPPGLRVALLLHFYMSVRSGLTSIESKSFACIDHPLPTLKCGNCACTFAGVMNSFGAWHQLDLSEHAHMSGGGLTRSGSFQLNEGQHFARQSPDQHPPTASDFGSILKPSLSFQATQPAQPMQPRHAMHPMQSVHPVQPAQPMQPMPEIEGEAGRTEWPDSLIAAAQHGLHGAPVRLH